MWKRRLSTTLRLRNSYQTVTLAVTLAVAPVIALAVTPPVILPVMLVATRDQLRAALVR